MRAIKATAGIKATTYDYIVVGGGTAGCVIAGRLGADGTARVLVLEAGRDDASPFVHIPAGTAKLDAEHYEWGFTSEPQRHCANQRLPLAQAKVIGGGGSINAQVFARGASYDYERWATEFGCTGWEPESVAATFRGFERNARLSAPYHGVDGPLGVSDPIDPSPLSLAFVKAGQEAGLPFNSDFNGARQHGVGLLQSTTWRAQRCSTSVAYLKPVRRNPNVTVRTRATVLSIVLEGNRAVGVDVMIAGQRVRVRAEREVILTAGAFGSPHILQLSGIGDPVTLAQAGIPVLHALPGVGKNLQDHARVDLVVGLRDYTSMDRYKRVVPGALASFEYAMYRKGPLASTLAEAGAFAYWDDKAPAPDQQVHFVPAVTNADARLAGLEVGHGVTVDAYATRPESRGTVITAHADPRRPPRIDPNFLATDYDLEQAIGSLKLMREIMRQPSMRRLTTSEFLQGQADLTTRREYVDFVRAHIGSACHPSGACAMGMGELSVVTPELKVYGIEGLRVADSSVMPAVVSSNTQAPTVMIAERAAGFIAAQDHVASIEHAWGNKEIAVGACG